MGVSKFIYFTIYLLKKDASLRLPNCMRDANFSVSEAATLADISESTLRNWIARVPINPLGTKRPNGRIEFDGFEAFVLRVARDLVACRYTPHAAILAAFNVAGGIHQRAIAGDQYAFVGLEDDAEAVDISGDWPAPKHAVIAIPIGRYFLDVSEKASAIYEA